MSAQRKAKKKAQSQGQQETVSAAIERMYERSHKKVASAVLKSGAPSGEQSTGELKTARTLNTVATIGAGHALWTSLPESTRKKTTGKLVPKPVASRAAGLKAKIPKGSGKKAAIAGTAGWLGFHGAELVGDVMSRRSINAQLRQKEVAKMDKETAAVAGGTAAAVGALGGYVGSRYDRWTRPAKIAQRPRATWTPRQAAEFGGAMGGKNIMGMTSASNKAKIKHAPKAAGKLVRRNKYALGLGAGMGALAGASVLEDRHLKKSVEQSMISKSEPVARQSGIGYNIEKANPLSSKKVAGLARTAKEKFNLASHEGVASSRANADIERHLNLGDMRNIGQKRDVARFHSMNEHVLSTQAHDALLDVPAAARQLRNRSLAAGAVGGAAVGAGSLAAMKRKKKSTVAKRNFNAEADRQRRLGTYAGLGLGGGVVLGDAARRRVKIEEATYADKTKAKSLKLPKGRNGKLKLAALAAGAAGSTGLGLGAYKRGISERNVSYM